MKYVFKLNSNTSFTSEQVKDNYVLGVNETFEAPESGIYEPYSFKDGKIVGSTFEEAKAFANYVEPDPLAPEVDHVADLSAQLAQSTADFDAYKTSQDLIIQQLTEQVASLANPQKEGN